MNSRIYPITLLCAVIGTSIFLGISEKKDVSETEKRALTTWPEWTFESYKNGKYFHQISLYINDHFPMRDKLISIAQDIRYNLGIHPDFAERIIIIPPTQEESTNVSSDTITKEYDADFKEAYTGQMLIINGRVYPRGSGSPKMGAPFAAMVNQYANQLNGICNVYSCVAPLSSAFIPIEKYAFYNSGNKQTLNAIRTSLTFPSRFCDVFGEMDKHFGETMFYGTDHHWNARGAYYGYVAFCKAAGINPIPLENMTYERKKPFLGSLYDLTKDPEVAAHPDTAEVFMPRVETKAYRYAPNSLSSPRATSVFCNINNYTAFLCGDAPLIKITTNVKNGRKAAVVKNSMGNAFSVYLISHYEEIWVVDFRYSGHNLLDLIANNSINDLIFGVGMYAAMSHGTIAMMRNLGKNHSPALSTKKDSLKVKTIPLDTTKSLQTEKPTTDSIK